MKFEKLTPMLTVLDVAETVRFYSDKFGFRCAAQTEHWAIIQRDAAEIMFALPNEHMPWDAPKLTGSLYFVTDEVDVLWTQVKDDLEVCYPLEDFDYGMREFAVFDNNGYLIQFAQELD